MGMFFGSGPTPSPTSIPLGLPSLEDVFSGDFRVGLPYKKIHFRYQLVSKSQKFIYIYIYNSSGFFGGKYMENFNGKLMRMYGVLPFRVHCSDAKILSWVIRSSSLSWEVFYFKYHPVIQHVILSGTNGEATSTNHWQLVSEILLGLTLFSCTRCINCARKLHGVFLSVHHFFLLVSNWPNTNKIQTRNI